jgi:hypothetical protein
MSFDPTDDFLPETREASVPGVSGEIDPTDEADK